MTKRKRLYFAILFSTILMTACGEKNAENATVPAPETEMAATEDELSDFSEDGDEGFRELTQEELDTFTQFIRGMDAYGFLLSEYTIPNEADLSEIFYSGAGLQESLTAEEITAYLAACSQDEMYTDCVKITRSDVEKLVETRLGISLDDCNTKQLGVYLPEFDAYYHECGDTNYMEYICTRGLVNGNVYTLEFKTETDWNYVFSHVQTILEKTENGYQFISNQSLVEASDDSAEIPESDIDMITAWEYLKASYFSSCELEEISYDENDNLQVVIGRTEMAFGDEIEERPCESVLFIDEVEENYYTFGWYNVFYDGDTIYATQTRGWYRVNRLTREVSIL